jgi:copper chaperone
MEKTTLNVVGMRCAHCVESVTKAIKPFATDIAVDLKGGTVSFAYDPQKTKIEAIKSAIDDVGFEVKE